MKNHENRPGTTKLTWNHEKPWKPTRNHEKPTWNHEKPWKPTWNLEKPWKTMKTDLGRAGISKNVTDRTFLLYIDYVRRIRGNTNTWKRCETWRPIPVPLSSQVCARSPPTCPDSSVSKEGEFAGQEDLRNHFIFFIFACAGSPTAIPSRSRRGSSYWRGNKRRKPPPRWSPWWWWTGSPCWWYLW